MPRNSENSTHEVYKQIDPETRQKEDKQRFP